MSDRSVFVGNLSWDTTWQSLKDHMRQAGTVIHAEVFQENSGRSAGCGLAQYELQQEAALAIQTLNDSVLDGRQIFVREDREAGRRNVGMGGVGGPMVGGGHYGGYGDAGYRDYGGNNYRMDYGGGPGHHGGPRSDRGRKLFVTNLPYHTQWQELKDIFRSCGTVIRADVLVGPDGRSKGLGTIVFENEHEAGLAINQLNGAELDGRVIEVRLDRY